MLSRIPVDSPITCLSYRRNTLAVGTQESSIWIHDFQVPLSERELEDNASDCFPHGPPIDTCLNTRAGRSRLSSFFQNSIARIRPISTSVRVGS